MCPICLFTTIRLRSVFGLWRHVILSFPLELIFLGLGAWLYARVTTFKGAKGRYIFFAFLAFLVGLQIYANFGPPPSSPGAMAGSALALYAGLAGLAAWVERIATVSTKARSGELAWKRPRDVSGLSLNRPANCEIEVISLVARAPRS